MTSSPPTIVILAGPNGAGKSTAAPLVLRDFLGIREFVNADTIAQGISGFNVESAAIRAGRVMLERLNELAEDRVSFAFETTLASRTFAPWLKARQSEGYAVHLVFFHLPSVELAVSRVATRVADGGHDVPKETISRRYERGLRNLRTLYLPLASTWRILDGSSTGIPLVIAHGSGSNTTVLNAPMWKRIREASDD